VPANTRRLNFRLITASNKDLLELGKKQSVQSCFVLSISCIEDLNPTFKGERNGYYLAGQTLLPVMWLSSKRISTRISSDQAYFNCCNTIGRGM
jgi:hypothetical protein